MQRRGSEELRGRYTHALLPRAGAAAGARAAEYELACLARLLRELELQVVEVEVEAGAGAGALELERAAVVCNGVALLARPSSAQHEETLKVLRSILVKELRQSVVEVTDESAKLNGCDVLFTGREFFVGISETSNEAGACAVADAFPEFPCTLIETPSGSRYLKRYISAAGPDVLCVGAGREAQALLRRIEREAGFQYRTLTVPEDEAANCLYVNGTLIHRAIEEIPDSFKVFCEKIDFARRSICFSELSKNSTGLTSGCLLVRKPDV